jgi:hypothetical protein
VQGQGGNSKRVNHARSIKCIPLLCCGFFSHSSNIPLSDMCICNYCFIVVLWEVDGFVSVNGGSQALSHRGRRLQLFIDQTHICKKATPLMGCCKSACRYNYSLCALPSIVIIMICLHVLMEFYFNKYMQNGFYICN